MKKPNFPIFIHFIVYDFKKRRSKYTKSGANILILCIITYFPTLFTYYLTQLMLYSYTSKEFEGLAGMKSVYGIHTIFYPLIEKSGTPLAWLFIFYKTMYHLRYKEDCFYVYFLFNCQR